MRNSCVVLAIKLILTIITLSHEQATYPYNAEGVFTGCWIPDGGVLGVNTFITLNTPVGPLNTAPAPATSIYIPIPNDPNPTVVNQNPSSLVIQFSGQFHLSLAQLCSGFNAPNLPGTLSTPQVGRQKYNGFYGSEVKLAGFQKSLPECIPPGVPGVVCNPANAPITLTSIDIAVTENVITGYLVPTATGFSVSNIPCTPVQYTDVATGLTIQGVVTDGDGFAVDPKTIPTQGGVTGTGWFSKIRGENLFYYTTINAIFGTPIPGQFIAVSAIRCSGANGGIRIKGAVANGQPGVDWPATLTDVGSVTITDKFTGAVIGTELAIRARAPVQRSFATGRFVISATVAACPRTIVVTWIPSAGTGLTTQVTEVPVFLVKV